MIVVFLASKILFAVVGVQPRIVIGDSMEPAFHTGDLALCSSRVDPEIGDVVVYDRGDKKISHRITGVVDGKYLVQGDNNEFLDPYLFDEEDFECVFTDSLKLGSFVHKFYKGQ